MCITQWVVLHSSYRKETVHNVQKYQSSSCLEWFGKTGFLKEVVTCTHDWIFEKEKAVQLFLTKSRVPRNF